jgi:hypothetical protein
MRFASTRFTSRRSAPMRVLLLLAVGTGLMLARAPRTHHCIHVPDAIDLTGPCGGAP